MTSKEKDLVDEVVKLSKEAYNRIYPMVLKTPHVWSFHLSEPDGSLKAFLKMELIQPTGSFKVRGAVHKLLRLQDRLEEQNGAFVQKQRVCYTASTGNHGMACSFASKSLGYSCHVYCPSNVETSKASGIKHLGANLVAKFDSCLDAELAARRQSELEKVPYISPYNDLDIISGHGTIGLELLSDAVALESGIDIVFVSVGGGGLIGGIGAVLKTECSKRNQPIKIIGCQPKNSAVMTESVKSKRLLTDVKEEETLSDATAGALESGAITFPLCNVVVDEWVLVTEEEIKSALQFMLAKEHLLVEGSAAVAVAGYQKYLYSNDKMNLNELLKTKKGTINATIILCGRNMSMKTLSSVIVDKDFNN